MLKAKEIDSSIERNILIGLITNTEFAKQIVPMLDLSYFSASFSRTVASWCIEYFQKYEKVPHKTIQEIFKYKCQNENTQTDLIEQFLSSISSEYSKNGTWNLKYYLAQAEKHIRKKKLQTLHDKLGGALSDDELDDAESAIDSFKSGVLTEAQGFSVTRDLKNVTRILFDNNRDELFSFPGAIGKLLGVFGRGDLVAVEGPAKRGKSFWLVEIATMAWKHKLTVLFLSLEMNEKQMTRRIWQNLLSETRVPGIVNIPKFGEGKIELSAKEKSGLDSANFVNARKKMTLQFGGGDLHLVCFPAYSATVKTIKDYLNALEVREHIVPDVLVVDYADIVAPEGKQNDHRHSINDVWKGLRALAQERNILVVTASHTNKQTFNRDIKQGDESEDTRKKNHVALMFAINQKNQEKLLKSCRIRVTANRHEAFTDEEVIVLQCLDIAKPILDSRFMRDIPNYFEGYVGMGKAKE